MHELAEKQDTELDRQVITVTRCDWLYDINCDTRYPFTVCNLRCYSHVAVVSAIVSKRSPVLRGKLCI